MTDAKAAAQWRSPSDLWLDHVSLKSHDLEWLTPARTLTLWSVEVPDGLLASLPNLVFLDIRGGSGTTLSVANGCALLRYLQVNQVRGMADLSVVSTLTSLEMLSLYGLPKITELPSLAPLRRLRRVEIGSMKGLSGLTGLHDAPGPQELMLNRGVGVSEDDAFRLAVHPTLREFRWYAEDVPVRVWEPFQAAVGKPAAQVVHAREWFASRGGL